VSARIYRGHVEHARLHPVAHRFRSAVSFYALDLDELPALDARVRGFGHNRFSPLSLRDRDYLTPEDKPLREKLEPWIAALAPVRPVRRVTLVTTPRWFGRVFNPVSFFLLHADDGDFVGLVAEVNNTFGDRHIYPVRLERSPQEKISGGKHVKEFHVSPFNNMEGSYRFSVRREGEELYIGVNLYRDGRKTIETWIEGIGVPLGSAELRREILRHPLRPWLTFPRILWQALLLKFKHRLPVFKRPEPSSPRTIRSRGKPQISQGKSTD